MLEKEVFNRERDWLTDYERSLKESSKTLCKRNIFDTGLEYYSESLSLEVKLILRPNSASKRINQHDSLHRFRSDIWDSILTCTYISSDFCVFRSTWTQSLPLARHCSLDKTYNFHILRLKTADGMLKTMLPKLVVTFSATVSFKVWSSSNVIRRNRTCLSTLLISYFWNLGRVDNFGGTRSLSFNDWNPNSNRSVLIRSCGRSHP